MQTPLIWAGSRLLAEMDDRDCRYHDRGETVASLTYRPILNGFNGTRCLTKPIKVTLLAGFRIDRSCGKSVSNEAPRCRL
jgi:hypothetical protein